MLLGLVLAGKGIGRGEGEAESRGVPPPFFRKRSSANTNISLVALLNLGGVQGGV